MAYIDEQKDRVVGGRPLGVEPICTVLRRAGVSIAPSTYYAFRTRPPSARAVRDAKLIELITAVFIDNLGVYRARKMWAALHRQNVPVVRCTVERLMRGAGLRGVRRDKTHRTTITDPDPQASRGG